MIYICTATLFQKIITKDLVLYGEQQASLHYSKFMDHELISYLQTHYLSVNLEDLCPFISSIVI